MAPKTESGHELSLCQSRNNSQEAVFALLQADLANDTIFLCMGICVFVAKKMMSQDSFSESKKMRIDVCLIPKMCLLIFDDTQF